MTITKVQTENMEGGGSGGGGTAQNTTTDTTNFNNNLSAADTDVQKALDTLDNLVISNPSIENEYVTNIFLEKSGINTLRLNSIADGIPKIEINGVIRPVNSAITYDTSSFSTQGFYDIYAHWNGSNVNLAAQICNPVTTPYSSTHPGANYTRIGCVYWGTHPNTLNAEIIAVDTWCTPTCNRVYTYINNFTLPSNAWTLVKTFPIPVFRASLVSYIWTGTIFTNSTFISAQTGMFLDSGLTTPLPGCVYGQMAQAYSGSHNPTPPYQFSEEVWTPQQVVRYAGFNYMAGPIPNYVDVCIDITIQPL